jgi:hypothetical protein
VAPATEDIAEPAGDAEPIEITPEEKVALATLISQAAIADGFKGKGYVRAWLQTHYKIDVSDIEGIPPEIRARVRAHALSVLERREQEPPREAPAPTTPEEAADALPRYRCSGPPILGAGVWTPRYR